MHPLHVYERSLLKQGLPGFSSGDTVSVHVRVQEAGRERIQRFTGVVIRRHENGLSSTFTVRKTSGGVGVERIFPLHSPVIDKLEIVQYGKVRRSRLYYLRNLKGKNAQVPARVPKERMMLHALKVSPDGPRLFAIDGPQGELLRVVKEPSFISLYWPVVNYSWEAFASDVSKIFDKIYERQVPVLRIYSSFTDGSDEEAQLRCPVVRSWKEGARIPTFTRIFSPRMDVSFDHPGAQLGPQLVGAWISASAVSEMSEIVASLLISSARIKKRKRWFKENIASTLGQLT